MTPQDWKFITDALDFLKGKSWVGKDFSKREYLESLVNHLADESLKQRLLAAVDAMTDQEIEDA
jgi:hypothetical protein